MSIAVDISYTFFFSLSLSLFSQIFDLLIKKKGRVVICALFNY